MKNNPGLKSYLTQYYPDLGINISNSYRSAIERQKLDFPVLRAHPEDALICKEYRRMWNVPPRNRYNGGKISLAGFKPVPFHSLHRTATVRIWEFL
jgi:hypothetical protein